MLHKAIVQYLVQYNIQEETRQIDSQYTFTSIDRTLGPEKKYFASPWSKIPTALGVVFSLKIELGSFTGAPKQSKIGLTTESIVQT